MVAEASSSSIWILPSARTRNASLANLKSTLLNSPATSGDRGEDTYTWHIEGSPSSSFSSKLTWECLRPRDTTKQWSAAGWYKGCIPKHAFNFWVAHLNKLPVRVCNTHWSPNRPSLCCICQRETETRDHLFIHCTFGSLIWQQGFARFGRSQMFSEWKDIIEWMLSSPGRFSRNLKRLAVQTTIFHIWKERNSRLYNATSTSPEEISRISCRSGLLLNEVFLHPLFFGYF